MENSEKARLENTHHTVIFRLSAVPTEFPSEVGTQLVALGEIRRSARRSTRHKEFIRTRDRFIERLEEYSYDEIVINKCKNLEFMKRPGLNFGKVKSKGENGVVCI